jgi:transcription initiation factor TFIIIB Brf1 subunit/transcription initiation factor TFIIB
VSSVASIVCDNCGAKWKLPESDQRSQAKCQKCGSVIDITGQRGGPPAAATAARPAVARPAVDRSKEPATREPSRSASGQRSTERGERSERSERSPRGARKTTAKASAKRPIWPWLVGGAVLAVAVALFFLLRQGH